MTIQTAPEPTRVELARHTLANGLRVCVLPDHSAPAVSLNLTYRVGSRDEHDGLRGFAHLFEHLMFQGSARTQPGEQSAELMAIGGTPNATTSFDRTNYFAGIPAHALDLALWFEADRMSTMLDALDQTTLDNEKEVVKNERRERMDNQPYGTAGELLFGLIFPEGHPYRLLPIGLMSDIDAATLDDVRAFFRTHYAPNNAALTIVGDVTAEEGIRLAEHHFGAIPANPDLPQPPATAIELMTEEVRLDVPDPMPMPAVYAGYRGAPHLSADSDALRVACAILGSGQASRLHELLVRETQLAHEIWVGGEQLYGDTTMIELGATLAADATADQFLELADATIADLAANGPTAEEMQRACAILERELSSHVNENDGLAEVICEGELFAPGVDMLDGTIARLRAVTADDVRAVTATYLAHRGRGVVTYVGESYDDQLGAADQSMEELA